MAILTFNFASSFLYATIFLFTLQFPKISRPEWNCLIRIDQVSHWLKNKKQYANEVKRNIIVVLTFLNKIETLQFHAAIFDTIFFTKKKTKKKLGFFTIFYLRTLFTGGMSLLQDMWERKTMS